MVNIKNDVSIRPIRWKKDFFEIFKLDENNAEFPKSRFHFDKLRSQKLLISVSAQHYGRIVGSLFCLPFNGNLRLLDILIDSHYRRRGIASMLLKELFEIMEEDGQFNTIKIFVRETNLSAQRFFRKHRFLARGVCRGFYEDTGEDAYRMELASS